MATFEYPSTEKDAFCHQNSVVTTSTSIETYRVYSAHIFCSSSLLSPYIKKDLYICTINAPDLNDRRDDLNNHFCIVLIRSYHMTSEDLIGNTKLVQFDCRPCLFIS